MKRIHANNSVAPNEPKQIRAIVETLFLTSVYNLPVNNEYLLGPFAVELVTEDELLAVARNMSPKKAPGPDGIPNRAVRPYPADHTYLQ